MRVVFFGTPGFAVPTLEALLARHQVVLAVSQPDRPAGRGLELRASPVAQHAENAGVPVLRPDRARDPHVLEAVQAAGADVLVVAAYGQILPPALLAVAGGGALNVHASLLPRWRGASPITAAILAGDARTGVSIMQMEAGLDTGPVLTQRATPIGDREDAPQLAARLAAMGAEALLETLLAVDSGSARATPQPAQGVTYAGLVKKSDGRLKWGVEVEQIERAIRAYKPWPGVHLPLGEEEVQVLDGAALPGWWADQGRPRPAAGSVIEVTADGIAVATASTPFLVRRLKPAGKREMAAVDYARGRRGLLRPAS